MSRSELIGPDTRTLVPLSRVALPLGAALLAEPVAWLLLLGVGDGGWYGRPVLLAAVHALTLGTLALAITGIGWQIVPVLTARAWNPRLAPLLDGVLVAGVLVTVAGFARPGPLGHAGAAVVVGALAVRALLVIPALVRAEGRHIARVWLLSAEVCLLAGITVGGLLWLGRAGHPVLADPIAGIRLHAALLLAGWVGGWIVGAGSLLLPMFAVAREPRGASLVVAALAWYGGIATQTPWLWGAGAVLAAGTLAMALHRGLKLGAPLLQAAAGLAGLLATVAFAVLGEGERAVTAMLVLFALPLLHGVGQRIVPFLAWTHAFAGRTRGTPTVASLFPARIAALQAVLSVAGGLALVLGARLFGASLLLAGALLHLLVLVTTLARTQRARMRLLVLPGMEPR